jgi:hypothetical protein
MKNIIRTALIAFALTFGGITSFATTKHSMKQVATAQAEFKGKVIKIRGNRVTIKDEKGKFHIVRVTNSNILKGIKIGDEVDVKVAKGKSITIHKL